VADVLRPETGRHVFRAADPEIETVFLFRVRPTKTGKGVAVVQIIL
jgi:hypothetical protein